MEGLLWKILLAAVVAVLTCALWWVSGRRRKHAFFTELGIPGPKPDLLWGNRKQLSKNYIEVMAEWIKAYGKVFGIYRSETPMLVVSDAEMIKQCFVKEFNTFHDKPAPPLLEEPLASSLPFLKGDEWKRVRTLLNPAFSAVKMRFMTATINKCADLFVDVLSESAKRGEAVNVHNVAQGLSLDVITKCALALKVDCQRNPDDPLLKALRNIFPSLNNIVTRIVFFFPAIQNALGLLQRNTEFQKTQDKIIANLRNVIRLRRNGQAPPVPDMLQLMLDAQSEVKNAGVHQDGDELLSGDRILLANCFIFIFAGFDTTSLSLAYTMFLLAKHPKEQDRLLRELTDNFPDDQELSFDDLQKLKRPDMVLKESMRLYPPNVATISRSCQRDITVMGQFIPAGTTVTIPAWHLHRDPDYWPDPLKFDPERFSEGQERHTPEAYVPFGLGPRGCIGQRFAMLELKATLCKVVRKFNILCCEETQDPLKIDVPNLTALPLNGIWLKLEHRKP